MRKIISLLLIVTLIMTPMIINAEEENKKEVEENWPDGPSEDYGYMEILANLGTLADPEYDLSNNDIIQDPIYYFADGNVEEDGGYLIIDKIKFIAYHDNKIYFIDVGPHPHIRWATWKEHYLRYFDLETKDVRTIGWLGDLLVDKIDTIPTSLLEVKGKLYLTTKTHIYVFNEETNKFEYLDKELNKIFIEPYRIYAPITANFDPYPWTSRLERLGTIRDAYTNGKKIYISIEISYIHTNIDKLYWDNTVMVIDPDKPKDVYMLGNVKLFNRCGLYAGNLAPIGVNKDETRLVYATLGHEINILDLTNLPKVRNEYESAAVTRENKEWYLKYFRYKYEPEKLNVNWEIYWTLYAFYYNNHIIAKMGQGFVSFDEKGNMRVWFGIIKSFKNDRPFWSDEYREFMKKMPFKNGRGDKVSLKQRDYLYRLTVGSDGNIYAIVYGRDGGSLIKLIPPKYMTEGR